MIVSRCNRLIFVKTRKTAGTSVEIALSRTAGSQDIVTRLTKEDESVRAAFGGLGPQNERIPLARWRGRELMMLRWRNGPVYYNHMPARHVRRILPSEWNDYFTFAIVRNPWEIVASAYHWRHPNLDITLSEFIASDRLARLSSWSIIADRSGLIVDEVMRFERLSDDLERVSARTHLDPSSLPHTKGRTQPRHHYRELMTPVDRDRVARAFHHEITEFGYEF
jgi:hypothetical protein